MAVSVIVNQVCDRCQKPFVEKVLKQGESMPTLHRQDEPLIISRGAKVLARFDDLCPECEGALTNLVGRLRLDPATPKKKPKAVPVAAPAPAATANTGNAPGVEAVVVAPPTVSGNVKGSVTVHLGEDGSAAVVTPPAAPVVASSPVTPPVSVDDDLF